MSNLGPTDMAVVQERKIKKGRWCGEMQAGYPNQVLPMWRLSGKDGEKYKWVRMRVVENGNIEIMKGSKVLQQEKHEKRNKKAQVKERDQRSMGTSLPSAGPLPLPLYLP